MRWEVRYNRLAIQGIYKIPRGEAAVVTEAIRRLTNNPRPPGSEPIPERPNHYTITVADHVIAYEVQESERVIIFLQIG